MGQFWKKIADERKRSSKMGLKHVKTIEALEELKD